ncbi:MAG: hypothetical protein WD229_02570, partial [Pirellulales bacterium]
MANLPYRSIAVLATAALVAFWGGIARSQLVTNSGGPVVNQVGITPKLGQHLPLDLEFVDSSG